MTPLDIIRAETCKEFGVSKDVLMSERRSPTVARPRMVAMWLAECLTRHSQPQIGLFFQKDRTTVGYATHRVNQLRLMDHGFRARTDELRMRVEGMMPEPLAPAELRAPSNQRLLQSIRRDLSETLLVVTRLAEKIDALERPTRRTEGESSKRYRPATFAAVPMNGRRFDE